MTTIYTLLSTDLINDTFDDINTNFSNLNTDKADKTGKLSQFASTTSSELDWVISDNTWSGWVLVFSNSPALTTPSIAAITVSGWVLTLPTGASGTIARTSDITGTNSGTNTWDNSPNTNSWLVHTTWDESISGVKTFSDEVKITYWKWIFNTWYSIPALKTDWAFADTWGWDSTRITPAWSAVTSNMVYSWTVRNGSKWDFYVEWNETITGNIELGNASDTTISRVSAGVVSIEWVNIVKAWAVTTNWITMSTNKILGRWTASTGAIEEITLGTNLSLTGTTLNATGGWSIRRVFSIAWKIWATGTNVANTFVADWTFTISKVSLWYWTAWSGTLTVDVNKNGTTLFATTKPSITTTNQSSINSGTLTTTTLASWDVLTIDIDAVPWTPWTDLYVEIVYS